MSDRKDEELRTKKPSPPASNLAMAAGIWVWAAMAFYAPIYFEITASGIGKGVFNVLGAILTVVSLAGAFIELSKLWKTEALSYWGVGIVFLLPALAIHLAIVYYSPVNDVLRIAGKIGVYVLMFFGTPFFLLGIPHFFWKPYIVQEDQGEEGGIPEETEVVKKREKKNTLQTVIAVFVVLLNLATAVVKLVTAITS